MPQPVLIEISARHAHVSQKDLEVLFGKGATLSKLKDLSQPGQFAANECVNVTGPGGTIEKVRILGPARDVTQIELAATDARKIKIKPCYRHSGDIEGSPGCTVAGPKGKVELPKGVIIAMRHIHLDPATAAKMGVKDKQVVSVKTTGDRRVTFENVLCRVRADFAAAMHVDTDEGNAAFCDGGSMQGDVVA